MATQVIRRNVVGSNQTAVGGTAATVVASDWTNVSGWIATVELTITGIGVQSLAANAYYRRNVFKWTLFGAAPAAVGAVCATTEIEEDAAWDAHIALNGNNIEVHTVGDAAEVVNWSWTGTITFDRIPWPNPYPTLLDYSGSGFTGTMTNMESTDLVADSPGGISTHSCLFGGTNEFVDMGNVLDLAYGGTRSCSFWMKTSSPNQQIIVSKGGGWNVDGWQILMLAGGSLRALWSSWGQNLYFDTTTTWNDGAWHHVSYARGLYPVIDGVTRGGGYGGGTPSTSNTDPFRIGATSAGSQAFVGNIDEVTIYSGTLTEAESQWIYNGGVPRSPLGGGAPGGLLAWWKMGG
jgi:hypothetical protein